MNFTEACKEWNITLSDEQNKQFEDYFHLLVEWNEKMNLTAITDQEEVYLKHFLDSMSLILAFDELEKIHGLNKDKLQKGEFSLIDVGTGAGFPGIPLKILFPQSKIVLMDSLQKRVTFLEEVIRKLDLKNIEAVHARAEDLGKDSNYREQFDLSVSRAVANLAGLSEYCLPFVKVGGAFVSYKSGKAKEELLAAKNAIFLLGGSTVSEKEFFLPGTDMNRNLIVIEKKQPTSKKYPRKAGLPTKSPLT